MFQLFDFQTCISFLTPSKVDLPNASIGESSKQCSLASRTDQTPQLHRRHIAIATTFPYHAEVYSPFAWTLSQVLKQCDSQPSSIHIYDKETEFFSLLKQLGQLPGTMLRPPEQANLLEDIRSTNLFPGHPGAMIDLVYLVTGERDLPALGADLLKAWDERPSDKKFILLCGVHNGADAFWTHENLTEWSKRGALRLLTISDHVTHFFRTRLNEWADSSDPARRLSLYEYVKIDTFYPVSDFSKSLPSSTPRNLQVPCSALIQGAFEKKRRDYDRIFRDLVRLLRVDSLAWGYSWSETEQQYLPDKNAPSPPFVIHLLGWDREKLNIPREIEKLIIKDIDFNMSDFYKLVQSTDIVIPAFSTQGGYLTLQASSTVHTALENHVPLLATRAICEAYPHLRGAPSILRPASLTEMEAIGLLRGARIAMECTGTQIALSEKGVTVGCGDGRIKPTREFLEDVKDMLSRGWIRDADDWGRHLGGIWRQNEVAVRKILKADQ